MFSGTEVLVGAVGLRGKKLVAFRDLKVTKGKGFREKASRNIKN